MKDVGKVAVTTAVVLDIALIVPIDPVAVAVPSMLIKRKFEMVDGDRLTDGLCGIETGIFTNILYNPAVVKRTASPSVVCEASPCATYIYL